ncbi:MAG: hypothetical protein UZ22_OP11002000672 [Microgenomates bacterium OLB23]|nr:MAG: hypothetical protein UZ22_OP11002000672 [Microgenomates bacterium OLB23]
MTKIRHFLSITDITKDELLTILNHLSKTQKRKVLRKVKAIKKILLKQNQMLIDF